MVERYSHGGGVPDATLAADLSDTGLIVQLDDATGWLDGSEGPGKFWVFLGPDTTSEEKCLVVSRSGNTLTIASTSDRGLDGTIRTEHRAGTVVRHGFSAQEADDANAAAVRLAAIAGTPVGTTDAQTLTNKTLTTPTLDRPHIDDYTQATHNHATPSGAGNVPIAAVSGLQPALDAKAALAGGNNFTGDQAVNGAHSAKTYQATGMAIVANRSTTNLTTSNGNAYVAATGFLSVTFVAPPSGKVKVEVAGSVGAGLNMAYEIRSVDGNGDPILSGSPVHAADDEEAVTNGQASGALRMSMPSVVTGLDAGKTYYARVMVKALTNGQSATAFSQKLIITPQVG